MQANSQGAHLQPDQWWLFPLKNSPLSTERKKNQEEAVPTAPCAHSSTGGEESLLIPCKLQGFIRATLSEEIK